MLNQHISKALILYWIYWIGLKRNVQQQRFSNVIYDTYIESKTLRKFITVDTGKANYDDNWQQLYCVSNVCAKTSQDCEKLSWTHHTDIEVSSCFY